MSDRANTRSGYHSEFKSWIGAAASAVSLRVRRKMFAEFQARFPDPASVLDVGVTSESVAPEANFFEELFPHKDRITAVGIEDANYLEKRYPGLKFVKVLPGHALPFQKSAFEVSFSNAVIEHVVDDKSRSLFIDELARVSKHVYLTTPNKYFPIEPHTGIPLLHFICEPLFLWLLDRGFISKFYNSSNLRLLSRTDLKRLAEKSGRPFELFPVRFAGFISNWVLCIKSE